MLQRPSMDRGYNLFAQQSLHLQSRTRLYTELADEYHGGNQKVSGKAEPFFTNTN